MKPVNVIISKATMSESDRQTANNRNIVNFLSGATDTLRFFPKPDPEFDAELKRQAADLIARARA